MTTINVTARHIAAGEPGDCRFCPIALAVESAFPDATEIQVTGSSLSISRGARHFETLLPWKAIDFIRAYDEAGFVVPFSFDLDYPEVAA